MNASATGADLGFAGPELKPAREQEIRNVTG